MMGECNCACMPVQNSFGRDGLSFCIPCVCSTVSFHSVDFSTSVFPDKLFFAFLLLVNFLCCDYGVVFTCFPFVSVLFLILLCC